MRKIIQYLRSCFCNHSWEYLGVVRKYESEYSTKPIYISQRWRCTKCGYVMKSKV